MNRTVSQFFIVLAWGRAPIFCLACMLLSIAAAQTEATLKQRLEKDRVDG